MYYSLLVAHSLVRWLVVISLFYALFRAGRGYVAGAIFTKTDDSIRHWTATIAHVQLLIGFTLYMKSPVVKAFLANAGGSVKTMNGAFFGVIHIGLMLGAIVVLTIGSALAKRQKTDRDKFRTMLVWFVVAFIVILIAVPWPFSPLANRPYLRLN